MSIEQEDVFESVVKPFMKVVVRNMNTNEIWELKEWVRDYCGNLSADIQLELQATLDEYLYIQRKAVQHEQSKNVTHE